MRFYIKERTISIKFTYYQHNKQSRRSTTCVLEITKDNEAIECLDASVTCDRRDTFVKAIGRKKALEAVLKIARTISYNDRKDIWRNYLEVINHKKETPSVPETPNKMTTIESKKLRKCLREFLQECRDDMHRPDEQGVTVKIHGNDLDDAISGSCTNKLCRGNEFTIAIHRKDKDDVLYVNLASLIALARQ